MFNVFEELLGRLLFLKIYVDCRSNYGLNILYDYCFECGYSKNKFVIY